MSLSSDLYLNVPRVNARILELQQMLLAHYTLSPLIHLEAVCDQKRMKALESTKVLDELHLAQISVFSAFNDFNFCYEVGGNRITYNRLGSLYGTLNKRLKEWGAIMKKHTKQPEIAAFCKFAMDNIINVDLYAVMKNDLQIATPIFLERQEIHEARFPNFVGWEPVVIDWQEVNEKFKAAV